MLVLRSLLNLSGGAHSSRSYRHVVSLLQFDSQAWVGFWEQRHASHDDLETNPCPGPTNWGDFQFHRDAFGGSFISAGLAHHVGGP